MSAPPFQFKPVRFIGCPLSIAALPPALIGDLGLCAFTMREYLFNLSAITSLNDWWDMYTRVVRGPGWEQFGRNRDAYADSLSGGPGFPDRPCRFVFTQAGHLCGDRVLKLTRDELLRKRGDCHPSHIPNIDAQLSLLECGIGETLLAWILDPLYGQDDIDVYIKTGA